MRQQEREDNEFVRALYGRTEDGKAIKRIFSEDEMERLGLLKTNIKGDESEGMKREIGIEQKPCCSPFAKAHVDLPRSNSTKRNSQRELLSKIVVPKKSRLAPKIMTVKTEPIETVETSSTAPENCDSKSEGNAKKEQVTSSALLGLTGYGSDSSSSS